MKQIAELMAALPASLESLEVGGKLWQPTELFRACTTYYRVHSCPAEQAAPCIARVALLPL